MSSSQSLPPKQICEAILQEEKRYNYEHDILYGECAVADRLLARGVELQDAYVELHDKLHGRPPALQVFLGVILSTVASWNPEKNQEVRSARDDLIRINQQIAQRAAELAGLLEERSNLHDTSGFSSSTHYHVCQVIESASQHNYLFQSYVRDRLRSIRSQFDLKYWPSLGQCLDELASSSARCSSVMNAQFMLNS